MLVGIIQNLLSSILYEKIQGLIDKSSLRNLIETMKQKALEFEQRNDGTIIVSGTFIRYIENYNILLNIMEYVLQPETNEVTKEIFIENTINRIILYCKENGVTVRVTDKSLVKEFIEIIYDTVEDYSINKVRLEDKYLLYLVIQSKRSMEVLIKDFEDKISHDITQILDQLLEIRRAVFDQEEILTCEWFDEQNQIAIKNLGNRYLPEVNVSLEISEMFDGIARNKRFKKRIERHAHEIINTLNKINEDTISNFADELSETIQKIPFEDFNKEFDFPNLISTLNELKNALDNFQDNFGESNSSNEDYKLYHLREAYYKTNDFSDYINSQEVRLFNNPVLLIQGEGGIGKSHLIADVVENRKKEGSNSILLLGQQFTSSEPWDQIRNMVDWTQSTEKLLEDLNAVAQNNNTRVIIFIDAINEGEGKTLWPNFLAGFIERIKKYKFLGLVLTIRSNYINSILEDNNFLENSLIRATHHGFKDVEYIAMKKFFEFYKIQQPKIPLMNPEFRSPLFLLLFCKSAVDSRGVTFDISISTVFDNYIKKINADLAKRFNYYEHLNFVKSVIDAIIKYRITTNQITNYIKLEKIIEIIIEIQQRFNVQGNVIEGLISEGVLTQNILLDGNNYIYVTYEKLEDHMIVSYVLDNYSVEEIQELFEGNKLVNNQGIIDAMAIQAPEKLGIEIYEVLMEYTNEIKIMIAFIDSLKWRSDDSVEEKVVEYINQNIFKYEVTIKRFWDTAILLSIRPSNLFNAKRIFESLNSKKMPKRDEIFIPLFNELFSNKASSINRLIDWAMIDEDKEHISDDSIESAAIMLSWFLCTSNKKLRDSSTKAIIDLLTNKLDIVKSLIDRFIDIDDPYILERLFAIAYGCAVNEANISNLKHLSLHVYETVFDKEIVYPHILLRDYARNLIEYTISKGIELNIDINKINPPYKSVFPSIPSDNDIKKYKFDYNAENFKDYYWSQNAILNSMKVEYSRDGQPGGYGDFGRYVFQSYFRQWKQLDPFDLKNIAIKRIFDLGYDVEIHGEFDRNIEMRTGNRHYSSSERIGKKYQWIAFHELAAQVSDNYKMEAPWSWGDNKEYIFSPGPFEPYIRNIDPTVLIKKKRNKPTIETIDINNFYDNFDMDNESWLGDLSDKPNIKNLINLPLDNNKWLLLEGMYSWSEPSRIGFEKYDYPHKDFWIMIKSYIVKSENLDEIIKQLREESFIGRWMPEYTEQTSLFNKEYFCSAASEFFKKEYYGGEQWRKINKQYENEIIGKVMVPVEKFSRESGNEFFTEEGYGWFKPCEEIYQKLGLKYGSENSVLYDEENRIVCFDTSELFDVKLGLLFDKNSLFNFLEKNGYSLFWTILGEKSILGGSLTKKQKAYSMPSFSGVYYYKKKSDFVGTITDFRD